MEEEKGYVYSYQDGDLIHLCHFVDGQREGETITVDLIAICFNFYN